MAVEKVESPRVTVTDAAAGVLREALRQGGELHVAIDAGFKHSLSLAPRAGHEIAAESNGIMIFNHVRCMVSSCAGLGAPSRGRRDGARPDSASAAGSHAVES